MRKQQTSYPVSDLASSRVCSHGTRGTPLPPPHSPTIWSWELQKWAEASNPLILSVFWCNFKAYGKRLRDNFYRFTPKAARVFLRRFKTILWSEARAWLYSGTVLTPTVTRPHTAVQVLSRIGGPSDQDTPRSLNCQSVALFRGVVLPCQGGGSYVVLADSFFFDYMRNPQDVKARPILFSDILRVEW